MRLGQTILTEGSYATMQCLDPDYDTRMVLRCYRDNHRILRPGVGRRDVAPVVLSVIYHQPPRVETNNINTFDSTRTVFANELTIPSDPGDKCLT